MLYFIGVFAKMTDETMVDIVLKAIFMLTKKHKLELEFVAYEVCTTAIKAVQAGENSGAKALNSWVQTNANPALTYAKRHGAKKVGISLGTDDHIHVRIVESQPDSSAHSSKTKKNP